MAESEPQEEQPGLKKKTSLFWSKIKATDWLVKLPALLTALVGVINVTSAVTPALHSRLVLLEPTIPLIVRQGSRLTTALAGFALLMLAVNLWRRKRAAWLIAILVLFVSAAAHLLKGLDYEEASLATFVAVWLLFLRSHYHARSDTPSVWQGVRVLGFALLFTLAYGAIGYDLLDRHFKVTYNLADALRQTIIMFTQLYNPGLEPITGFGRYFAASIYIVGAVTLAAAALLIARPVFLRHPASTIERERARQIVEAHGCTRLARVTLLNDKYYFFSPGGSVVPFTVKGRQVLVLGDPIGPADDFPACVAAFKQHCTRNDWTPSFVHALPENLEKYRAAGFQSACIGHEAVVDLGTFTLAGGENKNMRTSVNRFTRLGWKAEVIQPPLSDELLNDLRRISDDWLTTRKSQEMHFADGWFEDDYIRSGPVIVIRDTDGIIQAFANILPEYQRNERTIDLMRHRKVENGLMDFLFVSLFLWAREQGVATFSLGFSLFSGVGEHPEDPAVEKALHFIYEHADQFFNFKGLHEFKEKFHPDWQPRYLIYPGTAELPAIAVGYVQALSGQSSLFSGLVKKSK